MYVCCVCELRENIVFVCFTPMASVYERNAKRGDSVSLERDAVMTRINKRPLPAENFHTQTVLATTSRPVGFKQTNHKQTNKKTQYQYSQSVYVRSWQIAVYTILHSFNRNKTENSIRNDLTHLSLLRAVIPENTRTQHIKPHLISIVFFSSHSLPHTVCIFFK